MGDDKLMRELLLTLLSVATPARAERMGSGAGGREEGTRRGGSKDQRGAAGENLEEEPETGVGAGTTHCTHGCVITSCTVALLAGSTTSILPSSPDNCCEMPAAGSYLPAKTAGSFVASGFPVTI